MKAHPARATSRWVNWRVGVCGKTNGGEVFPECRAILLCFHDLHQSLLLLLVRWAVRLPWRTDRAGGRGGCGDEAAAVDRRVIPAEPRGELWERWVSRGSWAVSTGANRFTSAELRPKMVRFKDFTACQTLTGLGSPDAPRWWSLSVNRQRESHQAAFIWSWFAFFLTYRPLLWPEPVTTSHFNRVLSGLLRSRRFTFRLVTN